ncbi:anthranilate phosphoribosyltransferase TrpD [Schizopora paradoxa]|uniref:Anthranilate phosphoribosyltransferase n=1 Tax=Schizopora paradoxa TaxID=27342 RepID=A0A0H2RIG7_9AGAM|nr:anthranilate phosphoribosyltransferase TrpD [Schizopora paradoxa]
METKDTFKPLLARLVKTPEYFTPEDLKSALDHIFENDGVTPTQIGAFMTALHFTRLDRVPEMLAAAARNIRERAMTAELMDREKDFIVDIVGTGGDGHDTFNVSTTAAVVAAGAGCRVCKHGSRASTSSSGSADLLQSLGCIFTPPTAGTATRLPAIPFYFILAPHYHPALALVAPHRKALPFRTMFNVLGPLVNPARPNGMVVGVAEKELGLTFARSLRDGGVQRALVVCGKEGLDEISCAGETWTWELLPDGSIQEGTVHSERDFGVSSHPLSAVSGGTPDQNAKTFCTILSSGSSIPEELAPIVDFVLINSAALLKVAGVAKDYKHGVQLARESMTNGKAWEALQVFKEEGQKVAKGT